MATTIYSKNNTAEELDIVEVVKLVCQKYDVPTFTQEVVIEKGAIPHSHPILTLNTKSKDERSVLAKLVHEQFHWYARSHPRYEECISFLKTKYDDDGEHNISGKYPNSYWGHIIVCFNTRNYLTNTLNQEDLDWTYGQWKAYPTLEKLIARQFKEVATDLEKFDMIFIK